MKFFAACLLGLLLVTSMASASVVELTKANFDEKMSQSSTAMVKFYAPWCGHCKAIKPIYEGVANRLADRALIAEVDCTTEKELCEQFGIKGFPTLRLFKDGVDVTAYNGERNVESMVNFVLSYEGAAMRTVASAEELAALQRESGTLCVVKSASNESALALSVATSADLHRSLINFTLVTASDILPEVPMESLTVYRQNETETYKGDASAESIAAFIARAQIPYLGEINPKTFRMYANQKTTGWIFLDSNSDEDIKTELVSVAQRVRDNVVLAWLNADLYGSVGQQMSLPKNVSYPAFVIESNHKHYILTEPEDAESNATTISAFIDRYINHDVVATILSEPVPEVETTNGLTTIVGNTLSKYVSGGNDLLILFHAPWCHHCKSLLPDYEKLAKSVEHSPLVVAKFDITVNNADADLFTVKGIPTIYFVPAGKQPVLYNGERNNKSILDFVQTHATSPVTPVEVQEENRAEAANETEMDADDDDL